MQCSGEAEWVPEIETATAALDACAGEVTRTEILSRFDPENSIRVRALHQTS